ncbi:MAG: hypothetical protein ACLP50_16295 [Solirubrobacteraceae bacterium]
MTRVIDKRLTAEMDGDFVVFLIGMRFNKLWKPWKWFPVFTDPTATSASGTRPDSYQPAATNACTTTCHPSASELRQT